jgi:hypothetical protein
MKKKKRERERDREIHLVLFHHSKQTMYTSKNKNKTTKQNNACIRFFSVSH